jgi:dihydroneopterin aldolase/D-erythro-7,8-dihydroneopterin triphosphate epimerase
MDRIHINDLQLRCIIGLYPEERREKQDVILNITLSADLRAAGASDDLRDTVDYKTVKQEIRALVEGSSFMLVEKLASEVARICLRPAQVERVRVRLDKPGALRFARSVAVDIERTRADFAGQAGAALAPGPIPTAD